MPPRAAEAEIQQPKGVSETELTHSGITRAGDDYQKLTHTLSASATFRLSIWAAAPSEDSQQSLAGFFVVGLLHQLHPDAFFCVQNVAVGNYT